MRTAKSEKQSRSRIRLMGCAALALVMLLPQGAKADCTTPTGVEADMYYNTTHKRVQFCDGSNWINMGVSFAGTVDNLGNHTATQALDMGGFAITNAGAITGTSFTGVGTALTALNASNLGSGTIPDTRFPATLPAISGVNLTALNASNLGSGTVASARLGSGTANNTTYLRGDGTWAAVSAGAGDNLGNHTATQALAMGGFAITNAGAITGTSFAGVGTALTALNATNLGSGTVAAARMPALTGDVTMTAGTTVTAIAAASVGTAELSATGTKTSATFLRGDNTWASTIVGNLTATAFLHSSDERLKKDIETLKDPMHLLGQLRGVHFKWKADDKPAYGFIAQEVESIMPDAVGTDDRGMKAVEYDQLIAPLVEAVKAQQAEIDQLKQEIRDIRGTTAE